MDGAVCRTCGFKCLTCEGTETNCITCADSRLEAPACDVCPTGKFDDNASVDC